MNSNNITGWQANQGTSWNAVPQAPGKLAGKMPAHKVMQAKLAGVHAAAKKASAAAKKVIKNGNKA